MRTPSRAIAAALGLTLSLTACGGHTSSMLPATSTGGSDSNDAASRAIPAADVSAPLISVPHMYGALAFSDTGRRSPNAPVSVSLTLRYNNQAELDKFVDDVSNPHSGSYRRFLTPQEFNAK